MKDGDIPALNQLIKTLEQTEVKLEQSYNEKDAEGFNSAKNEPVYVGRSTSSN